jgi:hypothetical protein
MVRFPVRSRFLALLSGLLLAVSAPLAGRHAPRPAPTAEVRDRVDQLQSDVRRLNEYTPAAGDFRAALTDLHRCLAVGEELSELRQQDRTLPLPWLASERVEAAHANAVRLAPDENGRELLERQEERYNQVLEYTAAEELLLASR